MKPPMSETSIKEYLKLQRERYARRTRRKARGVLPDECAPVTGLECKHLTKVPGGRRTVSGEGDREGSRRGRHSTGLQGPTVSFQSESTRRQVT
jgi:hypothetical protein